jgi:hypothetical protein
MRNFYNVLGITVGAEPAHVRAAFHKLAKSSHPDVNAHDGTAEERFKEVNQAYEILSDPDKRTAYDLGLKHSAQRRSHNAIITTTVACFVSTAACGIYFSLHPVGRHEQTHVVGRSTHRVPSKRENLPAHEGAKPIAGVGLSTPSSPTPEFQSKFDQAPPLATGPELEGEQARHLFAMGMEHIGRGDVIGARALFLSAANKGSVQSMRALAGTYDPVQLAKLKVLGMKSNVAAARQWYEKVGDHDAIAAAERTAREEETAAEELRRWSKPASDLAQFWAAYLSGDGLAYVVISQDTGEKIYRYGDVSRSTAQDEQTYTLYRCDTPHTFSPQRPEDLDALLKAVVVKPGDFRFAEVDAKYLSDCPRAKSAISKS